MIRKNVAEILQDHVTFELEAIDRMYLNAYVPSLQTGGGLVYFLKTQLGVRVPSTVMIAPMSERFVEATERFVATEGVDLITFKKGQRKDDVAQQYLAAFKGEEGVLFVGKAQEKTSVFRTEKRRDADGKRYPWIVRSTAMPNHYYVYILDRDFGPLFIKFCPYFLLHVESLSHDCLIGEDRLPTVTSPVLVEDQRAAPLRFGDRRVHALMHALCLFALAPTGFRHREFRDHVAQLQSRDPDTYSTGSMTYDLRRLRLHGLIERVPRSPDRRPGRHVLCAPVHAGAPTRQLVAALGLHARPARL